MFQRRTKRMNLRALIVDDGLTGRTAEGRAARALVEDLRGRGVEVVEAMSADDGRSVIVADAAIHALLIDWTLDDRRHVRAQQLIELMRSRNRRVPIFLMAERQEAPAIPIEVMATVDEFVWTLEDTAAFVGGRVVAAMERYLQALLPPLAAALMKAGRECEFSWHTPGHAGGTAFLKSPVGRVFFDHFGEHLLRADVSSAVDALGSLLDHTGAIGAHEQYAARVFGADRTYCVTNGTSASNRIIFSAAGGEGQVALCDRNSHISIEHGLVLTGAIPVYLQPQRNRYGIVGPIPPSRLTPTAIESAVRDSPLVADDAPAGTGYAVLTNSTSDGLCYDAERVETLLDLSVDRIHFDEAWYAYARFHPLYRGRHAMHGDPKDHAGPTVFATHSTHKLLAALSQASFLHIREGRASIAHERFNEAFLMHVSTSPLYPIIASNDVTAAMMDGPGGLALTSEAIQEAIAFRQTLARIHRQFDESGDWFFNAWNAPTVTDASGARVPFESAPADLLARDPGAWVLRPGEAWHGFPQLEPDYCMLDPIKVSIVCPGVAEPGGLDAYGVPAAVLAAYLRARGIAVEKTTDFTVLMLFSIGITKGKWGTLLNALLEFKRDHTRNAPLVEVLPHLVAAHAESYAGWGLRDLADAMFAHLHDTRQTWWMAAAFATLPQPVMTPRAANQRLVRGAIEHVPLDDLAGRVMATSVIPHPPGIPMLMPGESTGPADGPYLGYLRALASWDRRFPGFAHDVRGVVSCRGDYYVQCVTAGTGESVRREDARAAVGAR